MIKKGSVFTLIAIAILAAALIFQQEHKNTYAKSGEATFSGIDLQCETCKPKVKETLGNIIGIKDYRMNPESNTVTVFFDPKIMESDWIAESLKAAGFTPKASR